MFSNSCSPKLPSHRGCFHCSTLTRGCLSTMESQPLHYRKGLSILTERCLSMQDLSVSTLVKIQRRCLMDVARNFDRRWRLEPERWCVLLSMYNYFLQAEMEKNYLERGSFRNRQSSVKIILLTNWFARKNSRRHSCIYNEI